MTIQKILIPVMILVVVAVGIFSAVSFGRQDQKVTIQSNASFAKVTKDELIQNSDALAIVTVENIKSFEDVSDIRPGKQDVFSDVTVVVNEYLYNPQKLTDSELVLRVLGGETEDTKMIVNGGASFEEGEQAAVFLKRKDDQVFEVVGWAQGKYTIKEDSIGQGQEKVFMKDIFGKEMTLDDFRSEFTE
ncbi:MAG: hypothetical protein HGB03_00395 [Candidatus Yonathbacteria bacterium]|nr:hypothetical protein [Candidatus Yonathbacteria bacterium]NTW47726.1 hypothetical protein [Candidatus Yonathbacteria bacterium]